MRARTLSLFILWLGLGLGAAACGASGDLSASEDPYGGGGGASSDAGAGGVSFGGAQDIGEFRGILERGEIPGEKTLDPNGFFNEHYAEPPPVNCGGTLCINAGLSVGKDWLTGQHQAALQLSVNTNVDPSTYTRLPMNLVVVVDHSGSMASDGRLEKVKVGLGALIDNLRDEDRLAIVSFDDLVTIDAPFTATLDRAHLRTVVTALQPRGATNLFDGLKAGFNLHGDNPPSEKQNRVIFLSDGLATAGNTSQQAIIAMATTFITRGIGLTTVGVGNDFDVEVMRGLAERGAGNFYYVEDAVAATEVFTEELDYFMSPLALDIRIEASAATGWDFNEVVGSRLWTATPRTGSMDIPAVFLSSRISQVPGMGGGRRGGGSMIFIHLNPTAHEAGKVADLKLSYRPPGSTERITQILALDYQRDPLEQLEQPYLSYPSMDERFAMYNTFLGLRLATKYAATDYGCAAAALTSTRAKAAMWFAAHEADLDLGADIALIDKFLANLRVAGAGSTDKALTSCAGSGNPNPGDPYPTDDYPPHGWEGDDTSHGLYCSAGRADAGLLLLLGVMVVVVVRRRRRR